jgi:hypothetical protein
VSFCDYVHRGSFDLNEQSRLLNFFRALANRPSTFAPHVMQRFGCDVNMHAVPYIHSQYRLSVEICLSCGFTANCQREYIRNAACINLGDEDNTTVSWLHMGNALYICEKQYEPEEGGVIISPFGLDFDVTLYVLRQYEFGKV